MPKKHKHTHKHNTQTGAVQDKKRYLSPERIRLLRIIGWSSIFLIILNLVLFSFRKTTVLQFWVVLIVISVAAFGALYLLKRY